jgi:hypothetical protein
MEEPRGHRGRARKPQVVAFMREQFQIADSFTPILYKLRQSVAPVSNAGIRSV